MALQIRRPDHPDLCRPARRPVEPIPIDVNSSHRFRPGTACRRRRGALARGRRTQEQLALVPYRKPSLQRREKGSSPLSFLSPSASLDLKRLKAILKPADSRPALRRYPATVFPPARARLGRPSSGSSPRKVRDARSRRATIPRRPDAGLRRAGLRSSV